MNRLVIMNFEDHLFILMIVSLFERNHPWDAGLRQIF